ncbi:lysophospholipase-like protein 1 isoform X1 [Manacus candei]|uniref:lysophospholipase-like protein 1 isoform X1 n=1 Tax=Manacus candei TaxID=415023 RepID=UPI00222626C1|nr:lysophospholipase-like protein 1 isoform X1 [Manacus candei]
MGFIFMFYLDFIPGTETCIFLICTASEIQTYFDSRLSVFESYFGKPVQHIIEKNSEIRPLASLALMSANTREDYRPYTPLKGAFSTVWFDRYKISNDCPEHIETIDSMCRQLTDLINDEIKNGIAKNRILIGGFSMGGGMAMHVAYRFHQDLAGVFALSSFLNKDSAVYKALKRNVSVLPELFQCHGTADELVLYSWGEETNKMLKSLGVSTSLHTFPNLNHELNRTEIEKLKSWIEKKLPVEAAKANE